MDYDRKNNYAVIVILVVVALCLVGYLIFVSKSLNTIPPTTDNIASDSPKKAIDIKKLSAKEKQVIMDELMKPLPMPK